MGGDIERNECLGKLKICREAIQAYAAYRAI